MIEEDANKHRSDESPNRDEDVSPARNAKSECDETQSGESSHENKLSGDDTYDGFVVFIDDKEHRVYRDHIPVAELYDLAEKSPHEWKIVAELDGGDEVTLSGDDEVTLRRGHPAHFRLIPREHHNKHPQTCELTVVVNSDPVKLDVKRSALVSDIIKEVLARAAPAGREEDQWELKTESGFVLDPNLTLEAAGVECGSILYLSLKAGGAGEASSEILVDPLVSETKFNEQVSAFCKIEDHHHRRGIWLVKAVYPEVVIIFGAPNAQPVRILAFGAIVNFENYDLWAPSVRLVDPITQVPFKACELQPQARLYRCQPNAATAPQGAAPNFEMSQYMQSHRPEDIPFLCHAGVREYHSHPAHTGDGWLLHRVKGEGTLARVVEILFQYGSSKVFGLQVQVSPAINVASP